MPGFYSYVLEQRITFDASPINLAGSTADWAPVQSNDDHDPNDDSQSSRNETDLVGNATHTLLYAKYDTKDAATESDDEIGFRLRIGATDAGGGFGALGVVGVDANSDGVADLFLAYDGRVSPTVSIFEPGPGDNDTPASTSLQNAVSAAGAETNISLVDATTDPTATDTDLDDDGNTDAFVSFKLLFSSLKDQMSSVSGISLTKDSPLQFATFTLTQESALDGDIGGINGGNDSTETFSSLGVFAKAVTPTALADATPVLTPTADPLITSDGGRDNGFPFLFENGTSVTTVTADDSDGDTVTFSIIGGDDQDLFQIDSDSGALSFKVAPDFENPTSLGGANRYSVIVEASDGLGGQDSQSLFITVRNTEEPSVITSSGGGDSATVDTLENSTAVATVTASDDEGDSITFALAGGADESLFEIDANTGVLEFKTAPDFDAPGDSDGNNEYVVAVQATSTGGADTQTITVRVASTNSAPAISSDGGGDTAAINVAEETTAVTTVAANDIDGDTVSFEIAGGDDAARFQIDSVSGALSFTAAPNFEVPGDADGDNDYIVIVRANDGRAGSDTQTITVTVTDANDSPVISSDGGGDAAAVNIAENTAAVTSVQAGDVDGDTVGFSIVGGADAAFFQIDTGTGTLSFNAAPDFETPADDNNDNNYVVIVQASDGRGGTDTQTITVSVTNTDETVTAADETIVVAPPVISPDPPATGGTQAPGDTGPGVDPGTNDGGSTGLITGTDTGAPTPPVFDLSPPPAPVADAPAPADAAPAENATESLSEAAAEALAEAAAASLANLAPAAGTSDSEATREQTASLDTQTRDTRDTPETQQSTTEQGPSLILDAGIPDTVFEASSSFTFRLPDNVFAIVGVSASTGLLSDLSMDATLADGSPLPEWLVFDPLLNEFRGTLPEGGDLTLEIRVTATDLDGTEAAATFQMFIEPTAAEREPTEQGVTSGAQQSSLERGDVLTAPTIEAENAPDLGEKQQSTSEVAPQTSLDVAAKPSLTGQIQDTGFGKFQTESLRLALGRSG